MLSLSLFPYTLKRRVLEYSLPGELLKCLQVNRELRHYVLSNGAFQRRLLSVDIDSDTIKGGEERDEVLVRDPQITITTDHGQSFYFMVEQKKDEWTRNSRDSEGDTIKIQPTESWALFCRLPFCRRLSIELHGHYPHDSISFSKPLYSLVPRFEGRCVEELELTLNNSQVAASILGRFNGRVSSKFYYSLNSSNAIDEKGETYENPNFRRFLAENLSGCRRVVLVHTRLESYCLFHPDQPKMNAESIVIASRDANDFQMACKSILRDGLPSRATSAQIEISIYKSDRTGDLDPVAKSLIDALRSVANAAVDPLLSNEIASKFADMDLGKGFTYYQRRFGESSRHFYALSPLAAEICFHVKSEPFSSV